MDLLQLEIFIITIILYCEGCFAKRRTKRTVFMYNSNIEFFNRNSFDTIINSSIPVQCTAGGASQGFGRKRSIALHPEHIHAKFIEEGGVVIPHLMASEEKSTKGFKNLLNLGTFPNEEELDSHFPSTESPLYKHKLEEDLKKWSSIINRIKSANETLSANSNSDIDNVTSIMSRPQRRPSNTASLHRKISNFLVQNQISLEQLKYYVDSVGITTNPKILMSLEHRRNKRKRRSVDGMTTLQYCFLKGAPLDVHGDLMKLCDECAATTILPSNTYPHTINEVLCQRDKGNRTCLDIDGRPHGQCIQESINVKFLRQERTCRMLSKTGEVIHVQQWKPYFQKIRTGCICNIDKHSPVYIHMKPSFG